MIILNKGKIGEKEYLSFTTNHDIKSEVKKLEELNKEIKFSSLVGHKVPINIILEDSLTNINPIIDIQDIINYLECGLAIKLKYPKWERIISAYIEDINEAITDEDAISFSYRDCKLLKDILEEELTRLNCTKALTEEDSVKGKQRACWIEEFIKDFNKI